MSQALKWYSAIDGPVYIEWKKNFNPVYYAGCASVYRHKRWMDIVGEEKFKEQLAFHPHVTVKKMRYHFFTEWKSSRNPQVGNAKRKRGQKDERSTSEDNDPREIKRAKRAVSISSSSSDEVQVIPASHQ